MMSISTQAPGAFAIVVFVMSLEIRMDACRAVHSDGLFAILSRIFRCFTNLSMLSAKSANAGLLSSIGMPLLFVCTCV